MQSLRERLAVKPEDLRRRLDPATLPFQTTAEVAPVETTIGQPTGHFQRGRCTEWSRIGCGSMRSSDASLAMSRLLRRAVRFRRVFGQ
jgi:hypothetical protein